MMLAPSTASTAVRATTTHLGSITGACTVEVVTDYGSFLELETAWNDAVGRAGIMHPFLRHEWVRTWWDAFGAGAALHVLVVRFDGRIAAIAPLMRESVVMYGVPVRRIRLMHNDHTPRADVIVASHPEDSYRALWDGLREDRDGWDVLLLGQVAHESRTLAVFSECAAAHRCSTGLWKSGDSPYVTLDRPWDEYFDGLRAKFKSNLRNRLSRARRSIEPSPCCVRRYREWSRRSRPSRARP